jgi:membrane fusion protein (multidrug efflux system)
MTTRTTSTDAKVVSLPTAEAPAPATPSPTATAPAAAPAKPKRSRRLMIMLSVPVVLALGGGWFYLTGGRYVDTDNAYVQQAKVAISSDVAGRIASVAVHENQPVNAGDTLFTIDPEPYRIALQQAEAALAAAKVNVEQLRVAYGASKARLDAAKATLDIRQAEFDRKQSLATQGLAADAAIDDVRLALQQAQTAVTLAEQDLANATAALGGDPEVAIEDHPAVRSAMAARDNAQRNLNKTTVIAPAPGIVSQVASLNVGQFISVGATIASLVETDQTWISANFKETQLDTLRTGQTVEVTVDALPGVKFEGELESIGAATGSEFALIPAQNATGNWVKVTQRIPVRVHIAGAHLDELRSGMSANVAVDTGKSTLDKLLGR